MTGAHAVAAAVVLVWLGMVLAISFLEAPLKFRAPGVTLQLGLGIGRLVFRALNAVEAALAIALVVALIVDPPAATAVIAAAVAVVMLAAQLGLVRPALNRRTRQVLAAPPEQVGSGQRRSRAHYVYVALEVVKVIGLLVAGIALLA